MADFASAAMIRVLAQGMRDLGLDTGEAVGRKAPPEARVDLALKRSLVASALRQGGWSCLPLLGRGLHRLSHEPTHLALASAAGAADLFSRWQRLERYIHSRHRCVLLEAGEERARLRHVAIAGAAPPLAVEDLVVAGVLAALLEAIGLATVEVHIGRALAYPEPDARALDAAVRTATTAVWDFRWRGSGDAARPVPTRGQHPEGLEPDAAWPALARCAFACLVDDLMQPPPLPVLARSLGLPPRSLQRELGRSGLGYSALLAEARCRAGTWRLLHSDASIAEVGFLSGYADQPHFTRELQRRVGMTPAAYRQAFSLPASARNEPGAADGRPPRRARTAGPWPAS